MADNHTTNVTQQAEATAVAAIQREAAEVRPLTLQAPVKGGGEDAYILAVPKGVALTSVKAFLDEYRTAPESRKGRATLLDLESFNAHVDRFKDADSAIFANRIGEGAAVQVSLTCVFDYHRAGQLGEPRFGEHRAIYNFPISDEWKTWLEKDGEVMTQAEFAEFIESNITDIASPDGAGESAKALSDLVGATFASPSKLLELSRGLSVNVDARAAVSVNLSTGESSVAFSESHNDVNGAPIKVPGAFLLALPVFRAGAPWQIAARLRYRKSGGSIVWFYELFQPEKRFDTAFREACDAAADVTQLPLFHGSPE